MILEPGLAYQLHNETHSKSLLTLMNRLQMIVSYETFQRMLTGVFDQISTIIDNIGVLTFRPPSMSA